MNAGQIAQLAQSLARGGTPEGVELLKRSPVRVSARIEDVFLKVFLRRSRTPAREARALRRAAALGLPVPELICAGGSWVATRFIADARPASREDLPQILACVDGLHRSGLLHRDLHLGNLLVAGGRVCVLDLQRSIFLPRVPRLLRERELGFLAYSLGEPLPPELEHLRGQATRRAHAHWRSRTRRCLREGSGFTRFEVDGSAGFRRREADEAELRRALETGAQGELIKLGAGGNLYRCGALILKQHASSRAARRSWVAGHGLEVRGIPTGRALAWTGRWLLMRDEGDTLIDWIKRDFEKSDEPVRQELVAALAALFARLHRLGVYHADLKANNVLWSPGRAPRLVDYGRVRFARRVGHRRRAKNLAQLDSALPDYVPCELRERCFRDYLRDSGFVGDAAALRRDAVALSLARRRRWSGY